MASRYAFEDALAYFEAQQPVLKDVWLGLSDAAREQAFTVAGVTQVEVIQQVLEQLEVAIAEGTPLEDFAAAVSTSLESAWGGSVADPAFRIETTFRTNVQTAYAAGRYQVATHPDIIAVRPQWMFSAVLDSRTSPICRPLDGLIRPADDGFWRKKHPPLHFNAITGDTPVLTARGEVPVENVVVGDLALTHRGEWRRVYAVLRKREAKTIRTLNLSSGRALRVTHEHPILVETSAHNFVWRVAGDLQVGDHLVQHLDEVAGVPQPILVDPYDAPPLADEPGVPLGVMQFSGARPVVPAVDLQVDARRHERQIEHEVADRELCGRVGEDGGSKDFGGRHALPHGVGPLCGDGGTNPAHPHGVSVSHSCGGLGERPAPGVVVLPASLSDCGRLPRGDRSLSDPGSYGDAEPSAPVGERRLPDAEAPLDGADALALPPVSVGDQGLYVRPIRKALWHRATVITIADTATDEAALFDLSVEGEETYVAAGVVVHNCRSSIITLRDEQAKQMGGVSDTVPAHDVAAPGFGAVPKLDWMPSPAAFAPELQSALP